MAAQNSFLNKHKTEWNSPPPPPPFNFVYGNILNSRPFFLLCACVCGGGGQFSTMNVFYLKSALRKTPKTAKPGEPDSSLEVLSLTGAPWYSA